ncbi:MAG: T9SS type A sorting domain-containing protein [Bacteroidota bacterium]
MADLLTFLTFSYILHLSTMKHLSSFLLGFCLLLVSTCWGQLIPPSSGVLNPDPVVLTCAPITPTPIEVEVGGNGKNQLVQGPCYIFATIAALESNALQSCVAIEAGFDEWSLYNTSVLNGVSPGAVTMISKVIDVASSSSEGILNADQMDISKIESLPNEHDLILPGIGDFQCGTGCFIPPSSDRVTRYGPPEGGACCNDLDDSNEDGDGNPYPQKEFNILPPPDLRYEFIPATGIPAFPSNLPQPQTIAPGLNFIDFEDQYYGSSIKKSVLLHLLSHQYGCIALFENFRERKPNSGDWLNHGVFIYGAEGCNWKYKDSWPGASEVRFKSGYLDLLKLTGIYFISGRVGVKGENAMCNNYTIVGDEKQGPISYSVSGLDGQECSFSWTASEGKIEEGQNTSSIIFDPQGCVSNNPITISVEVIGPTGSCTLTRTLSTPAKPDVFIQGGYWDEYTQTACPNELYIANTNANSDLLYEWQVNGAQMTSTSSPHEIEFQTSTSNFEVKLRVGNACGFGPFETISGIVDPSDPACNGGPLRTAPSTVTVQDRVIHWSGHGISYAQRQEGLTCTLVDLNGKEVFRQRLIDAEQRLDVRHLASGLYILSIEGVDFQQREKVFLR